MSRRAAIPPTDDRRWVFNRLVGDYAARPGYPAPLVERLLALAGGPGGRVADLGAGTGLVAVPLACAGAEVWAVEPARAMLDALTAQASGARPVHAAAESTGLPPGAFDLVALADALQWVDPERGGREAGRLLAPGGALAVVTPRFADTPFMRALAERLATANRKARPLAPPVELFFSVAGLPPPEVERFEHEVRLEPERLASVIRSLSFAGPALAPAALDGLLADVRRLAEVHGGAAWTRDVALWWGRKNV